VQDGRQPALPRLGLHLQPAFGDLQQNQFVMREHGPLPALVDVP
jgi:hypothetical protein